MAVLKSFELRGNKLSFANWISNLSPTCTPFTSMIGKEQINQTQYSWQTDALAPAATETFDEGSQAIMQPRASTQVLTNFTTTLRRVVKVTDTNQATQVYGRRDEMVYQMGKAGKELLRDIEFMNLSTLERQAGSSNQASRSAGFKALVAGVNHPDQDTKAIVHTEKPWMDGTPAFTLKDIFKITTNLFISGSKADKIMFHPEHIKVFSDKLGYNEEEPRIYRLFDNLNEKFNMSVSKITDPLGRDYTLIPNRFMPKNEVYIFNENDWTQMVLRSPRRVEIGKTGSAKTIMVETEVGLRHRHPYASGVLSLISVDKTGEIYPDTTVLTAYTGDTGKDIDLVVTDTLGSGVAGLPITWESSDPDILAIVPKQGTTDANGNVDSKMVPLKPGVVTVRAIGDKMVTEAVTITVKEPVIKMSLDSDGMDLGERITCIATVEDVEGGFAEDGTMVTLHSNSSNVFFLTDPANVGSWVTELGTTGGKAETYIACEAPGTYQVWTSTSNVISNRRTIYVGTAQLAIDWVQSKDVLELGYETAVPFEVVIRNKAGDRIHAGAKVKWFTDNPGVMGVSSGESFTDDQGQAKINLIPVSKGIANIRVHCYGDEITKQVSVEPIEIDTVLIPSSIPFKTTGPKYQSTLSTFVNDSEGNPIKDLTVRWTVTPSNLLELDSIQGITDDTGVAQVTARGINKGRGTIMSTIDGIQSPTIEFTVGQGGVLNFHIAPNPTKVNQENTITGTLLDKDGSPIPDTEITFFVEEKPHPAIPKVTTEVDGSYEQKFILTEAKDVTVDAICASLQTSVQIALGVNP